MKIKNIDDCLLNYSKCSTYSDSGIYTFEKDGALINNIHFETHFKRPDHLLIRASEGASEWIIWTANTVNFAYVCSPHHSRTFKYDSIAEAFNSNFPNYLKPSLIPYLLLPELYFVVEDFFENHFEQIDDDSNVLTFQSNWKPFLSAQIAINLPGNYLSRVSVKKNSWIDNQTADCLNSESFTMRILNSEFNMDIQENLFNYPFKKS
ncbi:MAG: hypothetical protein SFY67_04440 [Candidatus Melainabacteria bacterium]|nr:hypothetical protein [Candidatus Melainabacteria bacterium]